jgi:hypothetical protein
MVDDKPMAMSGPFQKLTIGPSTKPQATIKVSNITTMGTEFEIFSNIALQPLKTLPNLQSNIGYRSNQVLIQ